MSEIEVRATILSELRDVANGDATPEMAIERIMDAVAEYANDRASDAYDAALNGD